LKLTPLEEDMMGWIDIPLPIALLGRVKEARALTPPEGSLGGGEVLLEFELKKWNDEEGGPALTEGILVQETAAIDEIQRYSIVLGKYGWSTWNFLCFLGLGGGVGGFLSGMAWKLLGVRKMRKN